MPNGVRHRKLSHPSFLSAIICVYNRQTVRTVHDMFRSWQTGIHGATANTERGLHINVSEDMVKLALYIISSAGLVCDWIGTLPTQIQSWNMVIPCRLKSAIRGVSKGLRKQELIGNIFILMLAGHETTATTMVYALAMLAAHPATQQRMYEEITLVLKGGDPEYKHIHEMAYTLAVMNETLRLFPPVIGILKYAANQQTLGKYTIPENTHVNLHATGLHYNPAYWGPDPTVFRPERWFSSPDCAKHATKTSEFFRDSAKSRAQSGQSEFPMHSTDHEEVSPNDGTTSSSTLQPHLSIFSYNRFAFIPFSEGARSCIGKRFAQVEFYHDTCTDCPKIYHTFT
ncbi:hypothetical protein BASA83_008683 [Batrachochytrium salamandrivorans]|nr:hypothetical protein BASA83_008683 [Batrachochytrium salamandrivorans]